MPGGAIKGVLSPGREEPGVAELPTPLPCCGELPGVAAYSMVIVVPICFRTAASCCWELVARLAIAATNIRLIPSSVTTRISLTGLRSTFLILRTTSFIEENSLSCFHVDIHRDHYAREETPSLCQIED